MPVRLEQNAMCRTQQAPAHATAECRMHHCPLCCPGRNKERTWWVFRRQAPYILNSLTSRWYRLPKTSMASLTWNSVWRNKNLQRDCTKDKQVEMYKGCSTSHRCQWHQHSHPLPSRHWHQPLTDRIRRRHRGKKITAEYRMPKYALWLNQQLNFYNFWTQRKLNKLINSISPFEKAKLGILLPIAVQLLLERHYCAPRRALLCHK